MPAAQADNTRRAYSADWKMFASWLRRQGLSETPPDPEAVGRFVAILRNQGVSVTVRKTKGRAIDAACGQLRRRLDQATTVLEPQVQPPDARSLVVS